MHRLLRYLLPVLAILLLVACQQQAPGTVLGTVSDGERPNGLHMTAAPSDELGEGGEGDEDLPSDDLGESDEGLPADNAAGEDGGESDEDLPGGDDASESDQDDDTDDDQNAWRCEGEGTPNPAAERLAASLDVDVAEIWGWFCQGYGLGEIRIAYTLSAESGTPVADLFALYDSGLGWGEIAQQLGLKPLGEDDDQDAWRCEGDGTPNPAAERLAASLDVDVAEIWGWFCQGYGLGEIRIAYTLSAESGTPVADLFALYDSGLSWGEIAQQLGLKPGGGWGNPHGKDRPTGNPHDEDNPTGNPHKDNDKPRGNPHGP